MKFTSARALAALSLFVATGLQAQALEDTTVHERFACLQRERELEPLADKTPDKKHEGLVRLKLRFVAADRAPKVEVLHDNADQDMLRIARRYVEGYRLPCLHERDHPVEVVQEFSFNRWGTEPAVPLQRSAGAAPRVKVPEEPFQLSAFTYSGPGKLLLETRFVAGREEPEVKVIFNGLNKGVERDVVEYVRRYRLEDAGSQGLPVRTRQEFRVSIDGNTKQYELKRDSFKLLEFVASSNFSEHPVDLVLDTMDCPFDVRVRLQQPYDRNVVRELNTREANPNRALLLDWLSRLQLKFPKEAIQKDLFGTDVRVHVPCGRLNLSKSSG